MASGGWLSWHFLLIDVTLDMDIIILGVQNLSFGRLGASTSALGGHFGRLGAPWGTMGAAGSTRGGPNQSCCDFEMILGLHFESLLESDGLILFFLFGLASWVLCAPIFEFNLDV